MARIVCGVESGHNNNNNNNAVAMAHEVGMSCVGLVQCRPCRRPAVIGDREVVEEGPQTHSTCTLVVNLCRTDLIDQT